jgi:hypothetical protein
MNLRATGNRIPIHESAWRRRAARLNKPAIHKTQLA